MGRALSSYHEDSPDWVVELKVGLVDGTWEGGGMLRDKHYRELPAVVSRYLLRAGFDLDRDRELIDRGGVERIS